jgi:hypothetical protein
MSQTNNTVSNYSVILTTQFQSIVNSFHIPNAWSKTKALSLNFWIPVGTAEIAARSTLIGLQATTCLVFRVFQAALKTTACVAGTFAFPLVGLASPELNQSLCSRLGLIGQETLISSALLEKTTNLKSRLAAPLFILASPLAAIEIAGKTVVLTIKRGVHLLSFAIKMAIKTIYCALSVLILPVTTAINWELGLKIATKANLIGFVIPQKNPEFLKQIQNTDTKTFLKPLNKQEESISSEVASSDEIEDPSEVLSETSETPEETLKVEEDNLEETPSTPTLETPIETPEEKEDEESEDPFFTITLKPVNPPENEDKSSEINGKDVKHLETPKKENNTTIPASTPKTKKPKETPNKTPKSGKKRVTFPLGQFLKLNDEQIKNFKTPVKKK